VRISKKNGTEAKERRKAKLKDCVTRPKKRQEELKRRQKILEGKSRVNMSTVKRDWEKLLKIWERRLKRRMKLEKKSYTKPQKEPR
jgi:hypothetical protein